jgi:hypothetical protein
LDRVAGGDLLAEYPAKILNISAIELNKHFQNPTIHIRDTFDVSGFGLGNIPTTYEDISFGLWNLNSFQRILLVITGA